MEDKSKLKENKTSLVSKDRATYLTEDKTYTKDAFGNRVEDVEQPLPLIEPDPTIDRSRWTKRQIQDELDQIAEENAAIKAEAAKNYTTYSTVTNNINTADDDVAQLLAKLAVACSETVNGEAQQQRFLAIAERARELAGEPSLFAAPATAAALLAPRPEPIVTKVGKRTDVVEPSKAELLTSWTPNSSPLMPANPDDPMNPVNLEPKAQQPPL